MTCRSRWDPLLRAMLAGVLLGAVGACDPRPPTAPPLAGFAVGEPGRIAVFVLDEVSRTPIAATVHVEGMAGPIGDAATDAEGRAIFTTSETPRYVEVASDGFVSERWYAVGRTVVMPIERRATPMRVEGAASGAGEGTWTVLATRPARVLHASQLSTSAAGACERAAGGACTFAFDALVDPSSSLLAFQTDPMGAPLELRVLGPLAADLDLAAAVRLPVTELDVTIPDPGAGATAVVGVPGFAVSGRVAVLPWPASGSSISVPDTDGAMGSAWTLFSSTLADGSASILVRRGVTAAGELSWPEFMAAPTASASATEIDVSRNDGDLLVVAYYAGETLVRHDLVPSATGMLSPPSGASRAVVRGIDTIAIAAGELDLDAAERGVLRIAERSLELP